MKSKLFKVMFFSLVAAFIFFPISISFAAGYAPGTCTISKLGAADNYNFITVDNPTAGYTDQWFRLDNSNRKELLATALTAYANNAEFEIYIEDDGSTVSRIRIVNQ